MSTGTGIVVAVAILVAGGLVGLILYLRKLADLVEGTMGHLDDLEDREDS